MSGYMCRGKSPPPPRGGYPTRDGGMGDRGDGNGGDGGGSGIEPAPARERQSISNIKLSTARVEYSSAQSRVVGK